MTKKSFSIGLAIFLFCGLFFQSACFAGNKPDSKFGGVQIGVITYSFRSMPDQSIGAILDYTVQSGISSVELMGAAVESYAGIPDTKDKEALKEWRKTVTMDKFEPIRHMFEKRGVKIDILKLGQANWSDEEIDYAFKVCKTLGARGLSTEISEKAAKRFAPFAEKYNIYIIFHNHLQPADPNFSFDKILSYSPMIMLNFDAGHYFGATGLDPADLIQRLHGRIASVHIKDKTGPNAPDPNKNRTFGQGQTPIVSILQLIQKNKWPITCDIELEYPVPENSDAVKEVKKCLEYCRNFLL